jgi:hypothetical protein
VQNGDAAEVLLDGQALLEGVFERRLRGNDRE